MRFGHRQVIGAAAVIVAQWAAGGAHAQLLDAVKGQMGGGQQGASAGGVAQGLGGNLPLSSLSAGSTGNAAGVLEFCIKNNYLGGGDAQSVKDQLVGKLGGQSQAASDPGYSAGAGGVLKGGGGKSVDLSGGGLKEEITRKACDQVLEQGKSFL